MTWINIAFELEELLINQSVPTYFHDCIDHSSITELQTITSTVASNPAFTKYVPMDLPSNPVCDICRISTGIDNMRANRTAL